MSGRKVVLPAKFIVFLRAQALLLLLGCLGPWLAQAKAAPIEPLASKPLPEARSAGWRYGKPRMEDSKIFTHALLNRFEGRFSGRSPSFDWDGQLWSGTDANRLWLKSEGEVEKGRMSGGDQELLYGRPIPRLRYFDAQAGVRADLDSGPRRVWMALGIEGLAPYGFDFEPTLYWRNGGYWAGRIESSFDLLLTQRLILTPQAEVNFYSKDDPERQIGSGFSDLDSGLRLRYEVWRKFAPYVGFAYAGDFGNTARYVRANQYATHDATHDATHNSRFVTGIRMWF